MKKLTNIIMGIVMICVIFMLIIPIPQIILETLFGIELLAGIILYMFAKNTFNEKIQKQIPSFVLSLVLTCLAISISTVRFCLTTTDFPIRYISFLYSLNTNFYVVGVILSVGIFVASIYFIQKWRKIIKTKAKNFLEKHSENSDKDDIDFYVNTDGVLEFLLGNLKLNIWCLLSNIIFGSVFGVLIRGESSLIAITSSIKNGMSFIFVTFLPLLLSARVLLENLKQFEHRKMVDKISDRER